MKTFQYISILKRLNLLQAMEVERKGEMHPPNFLTFEKSDRGRKGKRTDFVKKLGGKI